MRPAVLRPRSVWPARHPLRRRPVERAPPPGCRASSAAGEELLGRLVDPEDVPPRVREREASSARIVVHRHLDATARGDDARERLVGVLGAYEREHTLAPDGDRLRVEPTELVAGIGRVLDARVVRAVVVEFPAERLRVERLGLPDLVDGQLDVIDHVGHARKGTPASARVAPRQSLRWELVWDDLTAP